MFASIIIPVYNVESDLLEACIQSCIHQTTTDIEILIMANGVSEETYTKIQSYESLDSRIHTYLCPLKGVSHARNQGLLYAKGEWILFVDGDDWIESDYVEKLCSYSTDITIASFYKEYSNQNESIVITDQVKEVSTFSKDLFNVEKGVGLAWGKAIHFSFLKEHGVLFDESLQMAEDAQFCIQLSSYKPTVTYIPDCLYHYRFSSTSAVRGFKENYAQSYLNSFEKMKPFVSNEYIQEWNDFVAYHLLMICVNYSFNDENHWNYKKQKESLKELIQKDIFYTSIKKSSLQHFSLTRRIPLLCLKLHFYLSVKWISKIRSKMR